MKTKIVFLIIISIFLVYGANAQNPGDFRTKQNGNWNNTNTWQRYNGSSWVNAAYSPTYSDGAITVQNGHTVTVTATVKVDQTEIFGFLVVNSDPVDLDINNGNGTDLRVFGTLINYGDVDRLSGSTIVYESGSKYQHAQNGGSIEDATWNPNSTCEVTGVTNNKPTNFDQTFGHLTWNCPGQVDDFNFAGNLTDVQGNLTITSTNNMNFKISNTSSTTFNVGGNFSMGANSRFILSGGTSADNIMNVNGDYTLTGGNFYMSLGNADIIINIKGNFSMTGTVQGLRYNGSYPDRAFINFNGTTPRIFTKTSGKIYGIINFIVKSGAMIDFGTSVLGDYQYTIGTFTLESGASLKTAHSQGITLTGASGCIQVYGTRSYHSNAGYTFYSNSAQASGNGLPAGLNSILTIGSTSGATALTLTNGAVTCNNKLWKKKQNMNYLNLLPIKDKHL